MRTRLLKQIKRLLWEAAHQPWYIPLVGLICLIVAVTHVMPVTPLVIVAVMLRPQRWRTLWLVTALTGGAGAAIFAHTLQQQGAAQVARHYPELVNSDLWLQATTWIGDFGLPALAAVASLPLPQLPALIACAVSDLPVSGIFLAVTGGKLLKYGVLAWIVATFPERFTRYLHRND